MTINEYQQLALRTEPKLDGLISCASVVVEDDYGKFEAYVGRIIQGLMGLNGEAGECIDLLKKSLFQGHILDRKHLVKELGDVAWYLAVSADAIGYDLETIFKMNIDKLKTRYPEGFSAERSVERSEDDI